MDNQKKKMLGTHYSFIPRNRAVMERIEQDCEEDNRWHRLEQLPAYAVYAARWKEMGMSVARNANQNVVIYKDSVYFNGLNHRGAYYREMDLLSDDERIVADDDSTPTLKELNFDYSVAGSDEIGNGQIFKPIIVTAACVKPENMKKLIELNVRDSKEFGSENMLELCGEELTGITSYDKVQDGVVVETEYVTFCSRILTNREYDEYKKSGAQNKDDVLRRLHADVLNPLIKSCKPDFLVVDDFMNGKENMHELFYKLLDEVPEKVFMREKADALNMAVSCASVISSYFGNLCFKQIKEELLEKHTGLQQNFKLPSGANTTEIKKALQRMKQEGVELEAFLTAHAKTTFEFKTKNQGTKTILDLAKEV